MRFTILFLLCSCASAGGITPQNWKWHSPMSYPTSRDVMNTIDITKDVFEARTATKLPEDTWGMVKEIEFVLWPIYSSTGQEKGKFDIINKKLIVRLYGSCLTNSSLTHELIHLFARATMIEHAHQTKGSALLFREDAYYNNVDPEETVEAMSKRFSSVALGCD